jgi:hypothetical protein
MHASFTCWNCGRGFRAELAEPVVCPSCEEPTFLNLAQDRPPASEEPKPRPDPFEPGWTFLGRVRAGPQGYEVVTEIQHAVHLCLFDGLRAGDAGQLVGVALVYEVVGMRQGALVLQLKSALANEDEVDPRTVYIDPERLAKRLQQLEPFETGQSPLERLYLERPDQVLPRVEALAQQRNDPAATVGAGSWVEARRDPPAHRSRTAEDRCASLRATGHATHDRLGPRLPRLRR